MRDGYRLRGHLEVSIIEVSRSRRLAIAANVLRKDCSVPPSPDRVSTNESDFGPGSPSAAWVVVLFSKDITQRILTQRVL